VKYDGHTAKGGLGLFGLGKAFPLRRIERSARKAMLRRGRTFIALFFFLITLGPPYGYAKSIGEICEEKGIRASWASIVVIKAKRKLFFYLDGEFVKTYPVVFGKNPHKQKLYEGDNCTPEGIFRVVSKTVHEEWSRFILLNYPTWDDVQRYREACSQGLIPLRGGSCIGLGGGIGIHGTHSEALNRSMIDWTEGCISLLNRDIEELFPYVERGTLVFIQP
jgi:murein L,D-transpeptidase YafK